MNNKNRRINRLIRATEWEITEMHVLFNDVLMSNKMFKLMLKENKDILIRFNQLEDRKFKLRRLQFKN